MNAFRQSCAMAMLAAGSLVALPSAFAAGTSAKGGTSTYQTERAMCGQIQQDKAACIREAGAAAQASRQGNLTHASDATYRQNALARCQAQPAEDRKACEQRVTGAGNTTIEGSVLGGGAIRETVTQAPVSTTVQPASTMPPASTVPPPNTLPSTLPGSSSMPRSTTIPPAAEPMPATPPVPATVPPPRAPGPSTIN
ncbi:hypothetical protein [Variovorax soli]|uniref:hypothetical protein n=1 Tax=Variovorax soli TaxID=376815 RepID=UPI000A035D1D|nr:hypothetical protein [Variovorax soli]